MNTVTVTPDLVGKYLNRYGYSDINVMGKIIAIKSKTKVVIRKVIAVKDPNWKPEWIPGGFSAICTNIHDQKYSFVESEETIEVRISKGLLRTIKIQDYPREFYDYNF